MKKLILLLLISAVFLSGCQLPGGQVGLVGKGTQGVIIKSFSPSDTNVEPNTPVLLTLIVSNVGSEKANNVNSELFGLTDEWRIDEGRIQPIGELFGTDPSRGVNQGEERPVIWTAYGPEKNVELSYDTTVRVTYTYDTELDATVKAVSSDYYQQKKEKSQIQSQKTTGGPLTITAKVTAVSISGARIPIRFEIQNSGGGRVYLGGSPTVNNLDRLVVSVTGANCQRNDLRLIQGKSYVLYCTIDTGAVSNYKLIPIKLTTIYNYFVDSTTSVTVLSKAQT
jgi:hypothetical protein